MVGAVVANEDVESAFADQGSDHAVRFDSEPAHSFKVGRHVSLADQSAFDADLAKMIAESRLADPERKPVPSRSVAAHVAARVVAHPARTANRRLHVGPVEADAGRRQLVEIRRRDMLGPVAAEVIPSQLVRHDPQDVH